MNVSAILAQTGVEVRLRLRSPATAFAVLLLGAGAVLWIPDPSGRAASLSWHGTDGTVQSSVYSSHYLSWAAAIVGGILSLAGFYLVAGSVRQDRERGVGAILAATPLSGPAYLTGKFCAHAAYLGVLSCLAVVAAVVAFVRWGSGAFHPGDFLTAWALFILPGIVVTAAMALFFDVTPGLRGRAGLVLWFFAFAALASGFTPRGKDGRLEHLPVLDPFGITTLDALVERSLPGATRFSSGLIFHDTPITRVAWPGVTLTRAVVAQRGRSLLVALFPLGFAALLFDRFDPARGRLTRRRGGERSVLLAPAFESLPVVAAAIAFAGAPPVPTASRAVLAETRLIWDSASILKWPLLACALGAPFLPATMFSFGAAAFLLLLAPVIAEVASREDLAGTRSLVFSQPGVPGSPVLWKAGALLAFVLVLGIPCLVAATLRGAGFGFLAGLLFTASAAASLGALSRGGKLFLGVYTALWYLAVSRLPFADFTGLFAARSFLRAAAYVFLGALWVGAALAVERARSRI